MTTADLRDESQIRPLHQDDAQIIADAFTAIGWNKPVEQYRRYCEQQRAGTRNCWVATVNSAFAGYVTLNRKPEYQAIVGREIPEIQDLNVLPAFRRRGIATKLLDEAEDAACVTSQVVAIAVGLHPGYNAAQRLYVQRGYVPDGLGVTYEGRYVEEGQHVQVDDALVLHFMKNLAPSPAR